MFGWFRKKTRPALPEGQHYVDETDGGKLFTAMAKACPACKLKPPQWMEGPSGGMSTNLFCGKCGEGYNVTPVVGTADKIHQNDRYILQEFKKFKR